MKRTQNEEDSKLKNEFETRKSKKHTPRYTRKASSARNLKTERPDTRQKRGRPGPNSNYNKKRARTNKQRTHRRSMTTLQPKASFTNSVSHRRFGPNCDQTDVLIQESLSADERRKYSKNHQGTSARSYENTYNKNRAQNPNLSLDATDQERDRQTNLLIGRNPIREALKAGRDMERLLVQRGELSGSAQEIVMRAKRAGIVVQIVDRKALDRMAPNHQGIIAVTSAHKYSTIQEIFKKAKEKKEDPFIIILDGITDPHNLGAIIRTGECIGAHGIIIPQRRAVGLTPATVKVSAGAIEHMPIVRVKNLANTIDRLKKQNIWIFAADAKGEDFRKVKFSGPMALIIGAEGEGISKLVLSKSDKQISIPIKGEIEHLNASVATGILLYNILEQRKPK